MNKFSAWHFDGPGPKPEKLGYMPLNFVAESPDLLIGSQAARVAATADGLNPHEALVINCEKYGVPNVVGAITCLQAARVANPNGLYSVYVPQLHGDRWGICGRWTDPKDNARAVAQVQETVRQLDPWVDFWSVDLFRATQTMSATEEAPMRFGQLSADATWELVAATRVSMLEHTNKPWVGFLGINLLPSVNRAESQPLDPDTVYQDALWCKAKGADGIVVMVWDDARKKSQGIGSVKLTPEITRALTAIGKL